MASATVLLIFLPFRWLSAVENILFQSKSRSKGSHAVWNLSLPGILLGNYYVTIKQSYKNPIGRNEKAGGIVP